MSFRRLTRVRKRKIFMPKKPMAGTIAVGNKKYKVGTSSAEAEWLNKLAVRDRQKIIYGFQGKIMVVDGIDYGKRVIYEYNGDYVHSIRAYPKAKWDVKTWMGKTPREMYLGTIARYNFLHAAGWKVFFVFESQYKKGFLGRFYRGPGDDLY